MKWILSFLVAIVFCFETQANTFTIVNEVLGEPFYRSLPSITYQTSRPMTGTFTLNLHGQNGLAFDDKWSAKVKKSDFTSCSQGLCSLKILDIPLVMEKYTCSIEAKFFASSGEILASSKLSWGECKSMPTTPDRKYLPDFQFDEDVFFNAESTIDIVNSGYSIFNRALTVWGYLKDKNNNIIWRGYFQKKIDLESNGILKIDFENPLKVWQQKLACRGSFILDPEFSFFEKTKKNNHIEMNFGECEESPSTGRGDKIDFIPLLTTSEGKINLSVHNDGRLPFVDATSGIETSLTYLDANSNLLIKKNLFTKSPLYGFGDQKEIISELFPLGACHVEIEINPNISIKESNYLNNKTELNICD